jgi:ribonuclease HI
LKIPDLDDISTTWFDGATLSNGSQSGAGGLIKITHNTFYKWTFNCGPGTNTRAKLLGAWATLYLASRLYIETLQVLGDSRIVIEWLSGRGELQTISLLAWKDRIRLLQPNFKKISYNHIYREHNKSVDHLSKEALQEKVGIISYHLWIDGHEGPPLFLSSVLRSIISSSLLNELSCNESWIFISDLRSLLVSSEKYPLDNPDFQSLCSFFSHEISPCRFFQYI